VKAERRDVVADDRDVPARDRTRLLGREQPADRMRWWERNDVGRGASSSKRARTA